MKSNKVKWVIGHKITPAEVSGDYDFVIGETPSNTPGPPPHLHNGYNELFMVLEGEMEFVVNGEMKIIKKGQSVDLPPGTVHTFGNKASDSCRWVNIHSPKGFQSFFEDMGVSVDEENAQMKSVDKKIIDKVMAEAANYDMHIKI